MPEEPGKCRLLGGMFAILVQMCLAFICVGTLVVKRHQERPQRDWVVWFMDATKQGLGSGFGHFSNIYLSMIIAESLNVPDTIEIETQTSTSQRFSYMTQRIHMFVASAFSSMEYVNQSNSPGSVGDECQWYCTTYVLDATLGTAFNLMLLSGFAYCIKRISFGRNTSGQRNDIMEIGFYGDPPQLSLFLPQLALWLVIVVIGKLLMLFALSLTVKPIDNFVSEIFAPIQRYPEVELVTVMIVIPTCLNALQFWLTDSFLKQQTQNVESDVDSSGARDALNDESDEEDNEGKDNMYRKNSRLFYKKKQTPQTELTTMNSTQYKPVWTGKNSLSRISLIKNDNEDEESVYFNMDSQDDNNNSENNHNSDNYKNNNKNYCNIHSSRQENNNNYIFVNNSGTKLTKHTNIAGDMQHVVSQVSRAVSQVVCATVAPIYPSHTHHHSNRQNSLHK